MNRIRILFWLLTGLLLSGAGFCSPPLQLYIEITPPGGTVRPPPGTYAGPVTLDRAITLDGGGAVTLDGGGYGTVLKVTADGAVVRGLRIVNSGDSFDGVDAGLLIEANDTLIENNEIDDVLFGVFLKQANGNTLRGNRIRSRAQPDFNLRGDGIRMWYSHENILERNRVERVRDIFVTNSSDNRFIDNTVRDSRVGMEFVFSRDNLVENNVFRENATGIVALYSDDLVIRGNRLQHARGITGSAFAFKESSQVRVERNEVLHCAIGVVANSPTHPENIIHLRENRFAYNDIAMYFYGEKGGHVIHGNRFEQNLVPVAVTASTSALGHDWRGNYWDNYRGFDRDNDGAGDTPHEVYLYADRIWLDRPMTRFFRASPVLETIDFIERLAPFSSPRLVLRDPSPRIR